MPRTLFALVLLMALGAVEPLPAQPSDEEQIRAARARSNAAITQRDLETLGTTWAETLQVTTSSGLAAGSGAEMADLFAKAFEDPRLVGYLRAPTRVEVSEGGSFAAELGEWTGRWTMADGEKVVEGVYMAQWQKREAAWRIRSEVFV